MSAPTPPPPPQSRSGARLHFPRDGINRRGFETSKTGDTRPFAEQIVRELLQNCLDANAKVMEISLEQIPLRDIPDADGYRRAFELARKTSTHATGTGKPRGADSSIPERIARTLDSSTVSILWCYDNGSGIPTSDLFRVLGDGAGSKDSESNRGGFGLGHQQFFGCSDLRYVLYATRNTQSGQITCAGQALLACHQDPDSGEYLSDEGLLVAALDTDNTLFERNHSYGTVHLAESRLLEWQPVDTGTLVGILGFNNFGESRPNPAKFADAVFDAASKHFSVFFATGGTDTRLTVTANGATRILAGTDLTPVRSRRQTWQAQRYKRKGKVLLSGYHADRTYDTLADTPHRVLGTSLWVRRLANQSESSRVHIFRDGMWITDTAPRLDTTRDASLSGLAAFDAAVNVTPEAPIYGVIKEAEPPSHLEILMERLSPQQRSHYNEWAAAIAEATSEQVGAKDTSQEWEDPTFATVQWDSAKPKKPPRSKPLPPSPSPGGDEETGNRDHGGGSSGHSEHSGRKGAERPQYATRPTGTVVAAETAANGQRILRAAITEPPATSNVHVVVVAPSGSDPTCDTPRSAQLLEIRHVLACDGSRFTPQPDSDGSTADRRSVTVPAATLKAGPFEVVLEPSAASAHGLKVELRRGTAE